MRKVELRDRGVYILPDATEVIAIQDGAGSYLLYERDEWEQKRGAKLEVDSAGQILRYGRATRWRACDLVDTGRSA